MFRLTRYLLITTLLLFVACSKDDDTGIFVGTWNISEVCGTQSFNYSLTITASGDEIELSNVHGGGPNAVVTATISGNSFTIPSQVVQGLTISGSGSVNNGTLNFNYSGIPPDDCVATGQK